MFIVCDCLGGGSLESGAWKGTGADRLWPGLRMGYVRWVKPHGLRDASFPGLGGPALKVGDSRRYPGTLPAAGFFCVSWGALRACAGIR